MNYPRYGILTIFINSSTSVNKTLGDSQTSQYNSKKATILLLFFLTLLSTTTYAQRVTTIDSKGTRMTTGNIISEGTTAPTNPTPIQGDVWFDTATNLIKTYNGSTWKTVASFDPNDLKDDQKIDVFTLVGNTLSLSLEDDGEATKTLDLSTAGTDDQNLSLAGNTLTLEDGGSVDLTPILGTGGTDDQNLTVTAGAADTSVIDMEDGTDVTLKVGTGLTIAEDTGTGTITLSATSTGTDDQNLTVTAGAADTSIIDMEDGTDVTLKAGTGNTLIADTGTGTITITWTAGGGGADPWFGTDDNAAATTNTENMYVMGNIGVGTSTLSTGKVATFAGDVDIQGVLDPTKIIMSGDGSIGSFNPTTNNQYEIEFQEGRDLEIKSNTTNNIMHIENTGNVGVRTAAPAYSLDVNGSFKNNNSGLFSVMGGNDDDVANTTAGGAPKRGIYMWDASNTNWGIYMSRPGIGKSLSSGDATRGNNFANHALRFRASDSNSNGFIFENTNEDLLVSIRSSDGYAFFGGQLQVHSLPTGTATDQVVVADSWGILRKRTTYSLAKDNEPWFGDDDDAGASSNTEDIYHMGQVGIGVNDPTSKLDVNGAVRVRVLPSGVPSDQIVTVRSDGSLRKAPASALEIPSNASAGTITSTANQIFGGSGWKYLGASITISPGKWAITGIFQFSVANGPVRTGTDQYRHILVEPSISASSRNTTGLTLFSKFITLTSTLYAGALNGVFWGQARGTIVVRNNTTSNKTIYFGVQDYPQYSKMRYLGSYGENTLSAIELAN